MRQHFGKAVSFFSRICMNLPIYGCIWEFEQSQIDINHWFFWYIHIIIAASHSKRPQIEDDKSGKDYFIRAIGIELQYPLPSAINISSGNRNKSENKSFKSAGG